MSDVQADALEQALEDDDKGLLDKLAEGIARRRMTTPAIFFLETMKPLGFVASQALWFFRPMVEAVLPMPDAYDRTAKLLARRGAIELLVRRLEARS